MTAVGQAFKKLMGAPDPAAPSGLQWVGTGTAQAGLWKMLHAEIGSGWFKSGFFYLFGEGLDTLAPCLEAWSFLVPPHPNRMILGRNAYGAIIVLENPGVPNQEQVHILDPVTVTYWTDKNCVFANLLGYWFTKHALPKTVIDEEPYQKWRTKNKVDRLHLDDILGLKKPIGLGGQLSPANFQLENIVDYYKTTAPIYSKAFGKHE